MGKGYHNLEPKVGFERGQKVNWYRGYGADGNKYTVEVFIKNRRDKQHWVAKPVFTSGRPIGLLPNYIYGRTLDEISKKLENLK